MKLKTVPKKKQFRVHVSITLNMSRVFDAFDEEDAEEQAESWDVPSWLNAGNVCAEDESKEIDYINEVKPKARTRSGSAT